MFCKSRHDRELLFHPDVDNHVFEERFSMTSNAPNDPILRKTEPNHNPVKKTPFGQSCHRRNDHLWCCRFLYLRDHDRLQCFRRVTGDGEDVTPFHAGNWHEAVNEPTFVRRAISAVKIARWGGTQ